MKNLFLTTLLACVLLVVCISFLVLLEHNTVAQVNALNLYVTFVSSAKKYRTRQEGVVSNVWNRSFGPEPLHFCQAHNAPVANTRFAITSLLTTDPTSMYTQSAIKLARSVRQWHSSLHIDMVLMITEPLDARERLKLFSAGWNVFCLVPVIEHPEPDQNSRFHAAKLYTKLNLWGLRAYDALLYMDLDTVMLRECSRIFTMHYPAMLKNRQDLGAVRDRPAILQHNFNAGVLLVIPTRPLQSLIASINNTWHQKSWAEQGLLNVLYKDRFYELPYIYNANLVSKRDEPALWNKNKNRLSIVHYTVSKGWESFRHIWHAPFPMRASSCWEFDTDSFCRFWDRL